MSTIDELHVAADWARLGAVLNVAPTNRTPDIEQLLLDSVRCAAGNSRLLIMAATWLAHYADCVAKRRLAVLIRDELEPEYRPIMGLLLDTAQRHNARNRLRFREALRQCTPARNPGPLLNVQRQSSLLRRLAAQQASALSRRWGCYMEDFALKADALRPPEWVAQRNPSLQIRALSGGDFVATIAADAAAGRSLFASESDLARRYGASRAAVRDALLKLKLAGYVHQTRRGKSCAITVSAPA